MHASHHGNTLVGLAQMILFIENVGKFSVFFTFLKEKRKIEKKMKDVLKYWNYVFVKMKIFKIN
jgi:hypothetical protein